MSQSETTTTCALDEALKYAQMGLRVFPLQPGTKRPMTAHGVKDATADPALIKEWWTRTPEAGIGLAARAEKVGDPCFLEFDQKPTLKDWAKNEGQPMPETRVHRSGGKGAPHFIFTHTEKSLALGNCDGSTAGREWFSFRASDRYIVAPPSIHPDSGKPYTVFADIEPTPIPDWVVDSIRANGTREKDFGAGLRPVHEDFDFDAFVEWVGGVEDSDGNWYPFRECPVAGRRHKGQGTKGCALYYDGGTLGFKCMAAECPSNMDRKPGQGGAAFLVSFLSKENGAYEGVIWPEREDQLGAVSAEEQEKLIEAIRGTKPVRAVTVPEIIDIKSESEGLAIVTSPVLTKDEKAIADAEAILAKWESTGQAAAAAAPAPAKEKEEPKPRKRGLYRMPETAMYGYLGEIARSLNAPLDLAYPTMLCVFAGQGISKAGSVRGNLYGCLIGPAGTGKSRTIDRALEKFEYQYPFTIKRKYPGSEHGLTLILEGMKVKDMTAIDRAMTKPFLLVQDEFRNMFAKSNIDNSALPYMLNDLFYHDEFETTNQKGSMACRPKLSIIGGLTCANAEEFADVFGKATTSGMYDRFIYGVAPTKFVWDDTWEKNVIPEKREPKSVRMTDEAYAMKHAWVAENPEHRGRLGELALRVALVSASANHDHKVGEDCMGAALEFMTWQEAIRAKFRPSEQDDRDGKCQEAIVRALENYGDQHDGGWILWKTAKDKGNLYRHTASRLNRIFKGMLIEQMVEEERDTDDNGKESKKRTGRVRLRREG
jgi:hypothetical protein